RADENHYTDLVEQAIVGFLLRRPSGEILMVNDAYCRLTGYTRDELLRMKIQDVVSSIDAGVLERTNALKVGESVWTKAHMRRKDGSDAFIEARTHRLPDGNLQSTVQDVTERLQAEQSRQESEHRYAELVEQALEGILLRRPSGEILFVNDALCALLGYTRAQLTRLNIRDLVHETDAETIAQIGRLHAGEALHLEKRMRRKDGQILYVEVSSRRLRNGDIQTTVHDLTGRKQAEQARRESEQRYVDLVEQAADSIWVRDAKGVMLYANDAACRMLGYTREELLRTRSPALLHPSDPQTTAQVDRLKPLETLRIERVLRHKDGHAIPVEASLRRLADGGMQVISHDISERLRAEERFRAMVEGSPSAILMVSEQGGIAMANAQAEKLFGYLREELLGKSVDMLVPQPFHSQHASLRAGYHRDPKVRLMGVGRDLYGLHKDGTQVPVEIGLNPVQTHEGRFVIASIIDISERKAAEARAQSYSEELRLVSQQLLGAQETERRHIARELHDEVGGALTAAHMHLQELRRQAGAGPMAEQTAEAAVMIAQLLQLVRQLSLDLHPSVLDDLGLPPAIRWVLRERAGSSGLDLRLQLQEGLPRFAELIELTLFRVFQESLSNVLRHAGARTLTVTLESKAGRLEMSIRDDGRGFEPAAAQKHVRAGQSLGVIGMRERVRLAGGEISIESVPGHGTEVRVSVPATLR
ncbi:MAG TPA: PAS domain S-box protein, partial [Gammaproteobacteria bacterium]|nr:PAS domain S-box protein [Gammaproteobacteria bacterium]